MSERAVRNGNHGTRIGADVGGTFTDLLLLTSDSGGLTVLKVPSVPAAPQKGLLGGLDQILGSAGVSWGTVVTFTHGSTLGVNTLIQRSGDRVGLLVTKGFWDILEIGRGRLPIVNNMYAVKVRPLVNRNDVREIDERVLASGKVLTPLRDDDVIRQARELVDGGIRSLIICLLHSYRYPAHELTVKRLIQDAFPDVQVIASSEIWPQEREFERASTAVTNAYIGRAMTAYYTSVGAALIDRQMNGRLFVTKSNGGIMTLRRAGERPIETLFSGPAAGVVAADYVGSRAGYNRLISLDIGGTSADVSIIDGALSYAHESQAGEFPVLIPSVHILSIGTGGGSIAWMDQGNVLKVGPQSVGADPGPACYGYGGTVPALTDAYVAVGMIRPEAFLGGTMPIYGDLAMAALDRLGAPAGLRPKDVAVQILQVATAKMISKFMPLVARAAIDPRDFTLVAFGGAGPTHAGLLAREIDVHRILVPPTPGAMCALGCLVADLRADFVRTVRQRCDQLRWADLAALRADMGDEARLWLSQEASDGVARRARFVWTADMRYLGQSFEISVPLPNFEQGIDGTALAATFHEQYAAVYGISDAKVIPELVNLRLQIIAATPKPQHLTPGDTTAGHELSHREIFVEGISEEAVVVHRNMIHLGDLMPGPVVIEQYDTTTFVPRGFVARCDPHGNLILEASDD